ncbi:hypothetical protein EUTSA_v10016994mg [Eutrema salsugineum]|uniref:C3H1-type domain-containing protein n=1 Tax=Eutrema salsugineum TaxID=72664 RepID=V4MHX5_EUTSA|nr:zinc finger CCCH domain-containing protein 12 [Eutrema salsugineum]ESQ52153.1 hypothetical protein EUTSA_v10016994mg [Eutrema salsugineum]
MTHRRNSGSDAVHVIPTNDPPPENRFPFPGDSSVWANEDDYSRVLTVNTDDTESPSKKTRGVPPSSSSSFSDIGKSFFKTKLCFKFRAGTCPYAANSCHFAHSAEELRRPPPDRQETTAETRDEFKIPAESGRLYKGRHCKKFYSGEGCPYGESCTFLHDEALKNRESFVISLGPHGSGAGDGDNVAQIVRPPNWKTRVCNKWEITGHCPFGANCHFAHGAAELHRFGGGLVEEEGKIGTSATPCTKQTGQADTLTSLVSPGVPPQRSSSAVTQKPNGVRTQRKWKGPDKISRVYGDWIDDIE